MPDKGKMEARQAKLSRSRLLDVLSYNPKTGVFVWLISTSNRAPVGRVAGSLIKGARIIHVDGIKFMAHRLAWFYVYGVWPADLLDHKDLNPDNNAFDNLRECTQAQNVCNVKVRKHCVSGIKGAHWHRSGRRWTSRIVVNRRRVYLGTFDTPEAAASAYAIASAKYHGEFGRAA